MVNDKISQIRFFLHSLEGNYSYTSKERIGPTFFAVLFCLICPVLILHDAWSGSIRSEFSLPKAILIGTTMSIVSFILGYILFSRSRYNYLISSSHVNFSSRPGKLKWSVPIDAITDIDFPPNSGKFSMRLHVTGKPLNIDLCDELRSKVLDRFDKNTNQLKV